MLESEMNEHLDYEKYEHTSEPNYRNGKKIKKIRGKYGEMDIEVPQDRNSTFEPKIVPKRQKDISAIEDKVISLYAKESAILPKQNPAFGCQINLSVQ